MNPENPIELVGFMPIDSAASLKAGAHFIATDAEATLENDQGWMTSVAYSPALQSSIGLGFIRNGQQRIGETVIAADPLRNESISVKIVSPHFVDPDGCLLYTSPSPRDQRGSRMPSSA